MGRIRELKLKAVKLWIKSAQTQALMVKFLESLGAFERLARLSVFVSPDGRLKYLQRGLAGSPITDGNSASVA